MLSGDLGKPCVQCGEKTLLRCSNSKCNNPLCHKCRKPNEKIVIDFIDMTIPSGLCEKCKFDLIPEAYKKTEKQMNNLIEYFRNLFE